MKAVASRSLSSRPLAGRGRCYHGALGGAPQGLHRGLGELVSAKRADTSAAAPAHPSSRLCPSGPCCRFPPRAVVPRLVARGFRAVALLYSGVAVAPGLVMKRGVSSICQWGWVCGCDVRVGFSSPGYPSEAVELP